MTEYLVIQLGERPSDPIGWIAVDDQGTRRGQPGSGTLSDVAPEIGDRQIIVLVPGTEVLTLYVDIPVKGARMLAALPYALEDQLAEDVENLHFAAGVRRGDGRVPVAVVAKEKMRMWLESLQAAGIHPARLIPEYHGLAVTPNTLSMLVATDRIMFNDGRETLFVIPDISPADALATTGILDASADDAETPKHLLAYCDAAIGDRFEKDWALLRHELAGVDVNLLPDGPLPRLAVTVASGAGINLLQGAFGEKTEYSQWLRPWRYAAMLLLGLFVVSLAAKGVDYYRLSQQQQDLQAQFTSEYRRLRPNDTRDILDPVGTVRSMQRSQTGSAAGPQVFLPSLLSLAEAVARNSSAEVEAVSYRAGVVDVRLTAPDVPTLDKIIQSIDSSGRFVAKYQSVDTVADRVNSRIQIREAGS